MKSQTSLLNKTLLSHFSGTVFWLTVVFMALNIIALPVSIWIVTFDRELNPAYEIPENFLLQMSAGQMIIGMIFSVFLAVFLLNYLNDEGSSDFMHILPVKRTALLVHVLITGLIAIVVPLMITAVILFIERMIFIPEVAVMDIGKWFVYAAFTHIVIFALAILAGFLVNGIFLHLQIIVLVLFLPLAVWSLTYAAATVLYDGIPTSFMENSEPVLTATFPYVAVMQLFEGINILHSLIWAGAAAAAVVLAFLLYKSRRNEYVTSNFNFKWLKEILTAVTTVAGMLAAGTAISLLVPVSAIFAVTGFGAGAIVAYLIVEMLFQKNVKIQFSWKSVVFTLIAIILFWIIFITGWTKYVNNVPVSDEVESVYVSTEYAYYTDESIDEYFEEGFLFNGDTRIIDTAIEAHNAAVENKTTPSIYNVEDTAYLEIQYKLTDGSVMKRTFQTLAADSEPLKIARRLHADQYDIHSDFLANIEEHPEMTELWLNNYMLRADLELIEEYKNNTDELMQYNPYIVNNTGRIEVSAAYTNNYVSGMSSIYNAAVLEQITGSDISIAEILSINQASEMYIADLSDDEFNTFIEDYKNLNIKELSEEYKLENLSEDSREIMLDQVNKGEFDPEGNRLLIYSYPEYAEGEEDYPAELDFSILAIQ